MLSLTVFVGCGGAGAGMAPPQAAAPGGASATVSAAAPGSRAYSHADLDALERQKAWSELVDHLEDVSPSQRDERWQALVAEAIVEHLKVERAALDKIKLVHVTDVLAERYPTIRTSPAFVDIRGEIAIDAVSACSRFQAWEWEGCRALAGAFRGDAKHAIAGAHVAGPGFPRFAMTLYGVALEADAKTVCADDPALRVMAEGIATSPEQDFHQEAVAMQARCGSNK